jgi:SAM-dependent methyltransferase
MDLRDLQRHWDTFGRTDPYWAILTDPARRGDRWDLEAFFATGAEEIAAHMEVAARRGVPRRRGRALDFGCGAGRLTQALAGHFAAVVGVDVAPSMVALARAHNRHGARCTYVVNDRPDLRDFADASFDLIYTGRVLQHIEPRYSVSYLREFVRVLAPGGFLSFDLPSEHGHFVESLPGAVPFEAMRATLHIATPAPPTVAPGELIRVRVAVTNASDTVWHDDEARLINVASHWLRADGAMHVHDGLRAKLPVPLAPGGTATVDLEAVAPEQAGVYCLQVDVVQEGVAWFAAFGSSPAEIAVAVGAGTSHAAPEADDAAPPAPAPGPPPDDPFEPVMEMHAVPRADVEALLTAAGARVLDVRRVHHCGPTWLAFRYDATR